MIKNITIIVIMLFSYNLLLSQTITSTTAGGEWEQTTTWVGGIVPGENNDVIIEGPVRLYFDSPTIKSLQVNSSGSLYSGWESSVTVNEDAMFIGIMNANEGNFEFKIGGNLQVDNNWYAPITFIGTNDHYLIVDPSAVFDPDSHLLAPESRIILTSDTKITSSPDFGTVYPRYPDIVVKEFYLNTESNLILENVRLGSEYYTGQFGFKTKVTGNGNALYLNDNIPNNQFYIQSAELSDLSLYGNIYINSNVDFSGEILNEDSLFTSVGPGGWSVNVYGNLTNNSIIDSDLKFNFYSNLSNNGYFKAQTFNFLGDVIHSLSSSNESWVYYTSEFKSSEGSIFYDSDFRIKANFTNMIVANSTLRNDVTLYLDNVRVGWSYADFKNIINGNVNSTIYMSGDNAWYEYCDIYNITFKGQTKLRSGVNFYDSVTNADTLSNAGSNMTVNVFGDFNNLGILYCASYDLNFNFYQNLINSGQFGSMSSNFVGENDQTISFLSNNDILHYIKFTSNLTGNSYQWYKNNEPVNGETNDFIQFNNGLSYEDAIYYCVAQTDGGEVTSRNFILSNQLPGALNISDVVITNLTETSTKIDWKTNKPATGFIFYAENDTTSGFPIEAMETNGYITDHTLTLDNLTTGSTYYFIIDQTDEDGGYVRSSTYSFVAGELSPGGLTPFDSALASMKKLTNYPDEDSSAYYDGAFLSNDVAYIVTNHNRLFKTTDGGNNWADVSPEQGTSFEGLGPCPKVHFYNENIGAVAFSLDDGSNNYDYDVVFGYVWITRDGGNTWSPRFDVNEDQILHLEQVSENVTMISGASAYGVSSNRWFKKIVYDPANQSYTLFDITPMPADRPHVMSGDWIDENNGIVLAKLNYGSYNLSVFRTTDGGASWTNINGNLPTIESPQISFSDRGIQMIDEDTFIFAYFNPVGDGYDTKIWATEDGGVNWFETPIADSEVLLNSLSIHPSADYGLICGFNSDSSKVFYVMYAEETVWQSYLLPEITGGTGLYATELTPDGSIWVIGNNNNIWKSNMAPNDVDSDVNREIPSCFSLEQNFPNPFSAKGGPATTINYVIAKNAATAAHELSVQLTVYDILGRKVATLVNKKQAPGNYSVKFDASKLGSGIYIYKLQSGDFSAIKKMILLK